MAVLVGGVTQTRAQTSGKCELPGAAIAHRAPTVDDASHTMCKCADPPLSLLTHCLFLFYSTDRFVFSLDGVLACLHTTSLLARRRILRLRHPINLCYPAGQRDVYSRVKYIR